ncbi:hypothetical protein BV898_09035 [Hypsibius exemplaris]|uniref:Uncharacterized protein n=1 Tax=Hypsibius exemplaris TaxID=2072580 RepID=A0A1W0WP13_HYPEX|nr:hypothetical protein BV898_09035 [Hypsibius exemplaris]
MAATTTTINVVALVASSAETIMPTVKLAATESNTLYAPAIHFNVTIFGNQNPRAYGVALEQNITDLLADFYYNNSQVVALRDGKVVEKRPSPITIDLVADGQKILPSMEIPDFHCPDKRLFRSDRSLINL